MNALIVGGGPAGAALATRLARAGREVVVLERDVGPTDKVCGEFVSREAELYLAALGVDLAALGAVAIDTLRLCWRQNVTAIRLPFTATSLSRKVLDEALLARAELSGAIVRRGTSVRELARAGATWTARLDDGVAHNADTAFLATGKHALRGHKRPPGKQDDLVAFKMHYRLAAAQQCELERHVELVLFEGGYAGIQPIEGSYANLCLLVRRSRFASVGRRWRALVDAIRSESPHLDARLTGAEALWPRPLALSSIPYGYVARPRHDDLWRLGDQSAVIPSFSGDGISIALHSAELAATTYLDGGSAHAYQRQLTRDVAAQVMLATAISRALVHASMQRLASAISCLFPALISTIAFRTRVPESALLSPARGSSKRLGHAHW